MDPRQEVLAAAEARAKALADQDAARLAELLHPEFHWTSHTGKKFDRIGYIESNTGGRTAWRSQSLLDPEVVVVGDAAVLRCHVVDVVEEAGGPVEFRMPMTQTWVRTQAGWQCLAGHAGPRTAT